MASYYAIQANGSNDDLHQSKMGSLKLEEIMSTLYDFSGNSAAEMNENVYYTFKNVNSGLYLTADEQNMNVSQQSMDDMSNEQGERKNETRR